MMILPLLAATGAKRSFSSLVAFGKALAAWALLDELAMHME